MPTGLRIIVASWVLFLASLFLPATNAVSRSGTEPGTPLAGWQAAFDSVSCLAAQPLVVVVEPLALLLLLYPATNVLMALAPLADHFLPDQAWPFALILGTSAILAWILPQSVTRDVFVGFYCWNCSFFLMSIGFIVSASQRR